MEQVDVIKEPAIDLYLNCECTIKGVWNFAS
jgi:hypothetical protein